MAILLVFISQKQTFLNSLNKGRSWVACMEERWKGTGANCTLHYASCFSVVHLSCLRKCIQWVGSYCFFFFLTAYFLRTNPWRWEKDLSKMWICLFRSWKYTGKRFSQNEDFGLCVVFTSVWFFGSFLLWKIESWLNMSTTQLNITFWGKFILCTPLPFYCDEKREEKKNERLNGL